VSDLTSKTGPWWSNRLYPVQLVLWVVSIACTAALLIVLVQVELFGRWRLGQPGKVFIEAGAPHVGVLDANLRRIYTTSQADVVLGTWESFLDGLSVTHHRVAGLDPEQISSVDVLFVPTPHGLTPAERLALQDAVEQGMSVLVGSSAPLHDYEALDLRSAFWREWFGIAARDVETIDAERFMRPPSDSPFDAEWIPGDGIRFRKGMRIIRMLPEGEQRAALPVHHGESGAGRWVHVGFDPTIIPPSDDTQINVSTLLVSSLRWLQREPIHEIAWWPADKERALSIVGLLEGDDVVPRGVVDALREHEAGVTWFVEGERDENAKLPSYGEVAVWGVPQNDLPDPRLVYDAVLSRADAIRDRADDVAGYAPRVLGMSEPELEGAALAEVSYVYASALQRGDAPRVRRVLQPGWFGRTRSIVMLPRTLPDDIGITIDLADSEPEAILEWYRDSISESWRALPLQHMTLRSSTLMAPGAQVAMSSALATLADDDTWLVNSGELAQWWRERDGVRVEVENNVDHRLLVRLSNVGDDVVKDLSVDIHLPEAARKAEERLAHWRKTTAAGYDLEHSAGSSLATLRIASIPPGANEAVYILWH